MSYRFGCINFRDNTHASMNTLVLHHAHGTQCSTSMERVGMPAMSAFNCAEAYLRFPQLSAGMVHFVFFLSGSTELNFDTSRFFQQNCCRRVCNESERTAAMVINTGIGFFDGTGFCAERFAESMMFTPADPELTYWRTPEYQPQPQLDIYLYFLAIINSVGVITLDIPVI